MEISYLLNFIYFYYVNQTIHNKSNHCFYKVNNNFYKDDSKYNHVRHFKNLRNEVLKNPKFQNIENSNLIKNNFIKRLVYKKGKKNKFTFDFSNIRSNSEFHLYLHKTWICSKMDTKCYNIIKKFKKNGNKKVNNNSSIEFIDEIKKPFIEIELNKNSSQKSKSHYIYHFIIVEYEKSNKNPIIHISDPFSLICFKQISKRLEKSFLWKKYKNKDYDLPNYLDSIFKKNSCDSFNRTFSFKINFYYYKREEELDKPKAKYSNINNVNTKNIDLNNINQVNVEQNKLLNLDNTSFNNNDIYNDGLLNSFTLCNKCINDKESSVNNINTNDQLNININNNYNHNIIDINNNNINDNTIFINNNLQTSNIENFNNNYSSSLFYNNILPYERYISELNNINSIESNNSCFNSINNILHYNQSMNYNLNNINNNYYQPYININNVPSLLDFIKQIINKKFYDIEFLINILYSNFINVYQNSETSI